MPQYSFEGFVSHTNKVLTLRPNHTRINKFLDEETMTRSQKVSFQKYLFTMNCSFLEIRIEFIHK